MSPADADFIIELVNEPAFREYIGDKGIQNTHDALRYIESVGTSSYAAFGFGLYIADLKDSGTPIGICGLLKRPYLSDVDIGFAFLDRYRGQGYAYEAAAAVLEYGRTTLGLPRIIATTAPGNLASVKLLNRLGLREQGTIDLPVYAAPSRLFSIDFAE